MKLKILSTFSFATLAFFFIGVINRDYEFDNPKLCIKYPTSSRNLYIPDEGSENAIKIMEQFDYVYELNKSAGVFGEIVPLLIIQFLLTSFFIRINTPYTLCSALIDLALFLMSFFILGISLSIALYWSRYRRHIWLFLIGLLVLNYLFNFIFRNLLFAKSKTWKNHRD